MVRPTGLCSKRRNGTMHDIEAHGRLPKAAAELLDCFAGVVILV
jgi:hypothetical protein